MDIIKILLVDVLTDTLYRGGDISSPYEAAFDNLKEELIFHFSWTELGQFELVIHDLENLELKDRLKVSLKIDKDLYAVHILEGKWDFLKRFPLQSMTLNSQRGWEFV